MSYLEYKVKSTPSGLRKVLYLNWPLTLLLALTSRWRHVRYAYPQEEVVMG